MGLFWDLQCVWTVLEDSLLPSLLRVLGDFHVNVLFHLWIYHAQQNSGFSAAGGGPELSWLQPILVVRNHIRRVLASATVLDTHTHTHRESQILALTQVCSTEDWQIWTWKHSYLIKNEDILLSQIQRWGDIFAGCLIASSTQNVSTILLVKEKKINKSLFSQFTINFSICLGDGKRMILSMRT